MSDDATIDPQSSHGGGVAELPPVLALTLVAAPEEPARLGETALVPPLARTTFHELGRGHDPGAHRLQLARQRPGQMEPTGGLASLHISRRQLRVRHVGETELEVQSVGRAEVRKNGQVIAIGALRPGDLLDVGGRYLFLCEVRPAVLTPWTHQPDFDFGRGDMDGIIGETPAAWELRRCIAEIASRPGHVLVRGPTGVGKELVVQALHRQSPRGQHALVARNAATIPETLADSELFGNARNYPQVGMPARAGLVGEADGTTLFLDEFAELPLSTQSHLLRLLDAGEYQALGAPRPVKADVRLIAATNRPESSLRLDLAARFTWRIDVPPLASRLPDVPLIARHLHAELTGHELGVAEGLRPRETEWLLRRGLEANVREVRAALGDLLRGRGGSAPPPPRAWAGDLTQTIPPPAPLPQGGTPRAGLDPAHIQRALDQHNGVLEDAYRSLGLSSRHALARLVRKYGLVIQRRSR